MSQFIDQTRDDLVRAANLAFATTPTAQPTASPVAPVRRRPPGRHGRRRSRRATVVVVLAVSFGLAGAGALAAVTGLWSPSPVGAWRGLSRGVLTTTAPPSSSLRGVLAVLRRPQTAADRDSLIVKLAAGGPPGYRGTIELSGVRLATRLKNGVEIFLVPELIAPSEQRFTRYAEGLGAVLAFHGQPTGGGCCDDARTIETIGRGTILGEAPRGAMTTAIVVPDGVARVRLLYGRYTRPGGHIYPAPLTLDLPVHGNVAAATTSARGVTADLEPLQVTWYAADGHTIKTYTNPDLPKDPNAVGA